MAFRVSNAIIVAGISTDNVTIRILRPGHAPVYGARLTLFCCTVPLVGIPVMRQSETAGGHRHYTAGARRPISIRIAFLVLLDLYRAHR
jgi:hypothetical protein